jgi:ligand-binding SRPBCC domain-containing protein
MDTAWEFFSSPFNLPGITPPGLDFKITSHPPVVIHNGLIISYRVTPLWRLPVTWITEIRHVDPPYGFVDEQRCGPYRLWHHRHTFRQIEGGVEMEDLVHYIMPMGFFGNLLHRLLIHGQLTTIFDFRRDKLEDLFGTLSGRGGGCPPAPLTPGS